MHHLGWNHQSTQGADVPALCPDFAGRVCGWFEFVRATVGVFGYGFHLRKSMLISCLLWFITLSPGNLAVGSQQTTESCQLAAEQPFWKAKAGNG